MPGVMLTPLRTVVLFALLPHSFSSLPPSRFSRLHAIACPNVSRPEIPLACSGFCNDVYGSHDHCEQSISKLDNTIALL